jgi:hypothetical protein
LTKALTDVEVEHLLNFVGYGELNAKVWFLGMEEAGGGEDNVRARLKFRSVEDCKEAHKILGITKLHFGKNIIQRTWRGMCYIMLRLEGRQPDTESIRKYQADHLGRFHGSSLLCELMPIPKPNISTWGYEKLIPQFASRDEYYTIVKPRRIKYLQQLLGEYCPKIVIGYGKSYWNDYKELFLQLEFSSSGQFLVARAKDKVVVLTDHFTARSMNGKFDEVVAIIENRVRYRKP